MKRLFAQPDLCNRTDSGPAFTVDDFAQKPAGGWRDMIVVTAANQFADEAAQGCAVVNIIPERQLVNRDSDFGCALDRLFENALGTPIDLFKHALVQLLQADQVLA